MKLKKLVSRYLQPNRYLSNADFSPFSMSVVEYRKIRASDRYEDSYGVWSRIYEYPLVLDKIEQYSTGSDISVHNSSWGFETCHIDFKNVLESRYKTVVNSDINPADVPNTEVWDITSQPPAEYIDNFDVVLNVSTVEEVDDDHLKIIRNLVAQIKPGGLLIMTFDLPGMQLSKLNKLLGAELEEFDDNLNGANSAQPSSKYATLNCGLLVLKREA